MTLLVHNSNYILPDLILHLRHNPAKTRTQMFPYIQLTKRVLQLTVDDLMCMWSPYDNVIIHMPTARNGIWVVSAFIEIKTLPNQLSSLCLLPHYSQKKPYCSHFPCLLPLLPLSELATITKYLSLLLHMNSHQERPL